jgi:two-component system LytT family response regulator
LLKQYCPDILLFGSAASADEGRELLKGNHTDIIFLDISMPREDGFAFLNSINKEDYAIIFVTAFQEYALRALKASAIDYLLKPVNSIELIEAVSKALQYHEYRKNKVEVQNVYRESLDILHENFHSDNKPISRITVADQFGFKVINVDEIMYLEADSNYTVLHLSSLSKIVATRTIGDFEKILNTPQFFRIHKSTIINMNCLRGYSSYEGNYAELTDGTKLSISRRKVIEFREEVKQFAKSLG